VVMYGRGKRDGVDQDTWKLKSFEDAIDGASKVSHLQAVGDLQASGSFLDSRGDGAGRRYDDGASQLKYNAKRAAAIASGPSSPAQGVEYKLTKGRMLTKDPSTNRHTRASISKLVRRMKLIRASDPRALKKEAAPLKKSSHSKPSALPINAAMESICDPNLEKMR